MYINSGNVGPFSIWDVTSCELITVQYRRLESCASWSYVVVVSYRANTYRSQLTRVAIKRSAEKRLAYIARIGAYQAEQLVFQYM